MSQNACVHRGNGGLERYTETYNRTAPGACCVNSKPESQGLADSTMRSVD